MTIWTKINRRLERYAVHFLNDRNFARVKYRWRFRRRLNLNYPRYFSEKIQVLKQRDEYLDYASYADKAAVREYVAKEIGPEYLNEQYGVYDDPRDIPFDDLPDRYVLKVTHGSGLNIIVEKKNQLDKEKAVAQLGKWMKFDYYHKCRELQYKNIKPRIVCERFLTDDSGELRDYKFLCFKGVPRYIQVDGNRYTGHTRDVYTADWKRLDVRFGGYPNAPAPLERLKALDEMLSAAAKLSTPFPFARIDFYLSEGKVYFGEITFHPGSGFLEFYPPEFSFKAAGEIEL